MENKTICRRICFRNLRKITRGYTKKITSLIMICLLVLNSSFVTIQAEPTINVISSESPTNTPYFYIKVNGLIPSSNIVSVYCNVWRAIDGEQTAKVYTLKYDNTNQQWITGVDIRHDFKYQNGKYIAKTYYSDPNGINTELGQTEVLFSKPVPVLVYHCVREDVTNEPNPDLFVRPTEFRNQMSYLRDNGYTPLFADEILSYNNNPELYPKPIMITFDDGYSDNYSDAFPILKEFGIKATIFLITGSIKSGSQNPTYLNIEQVKEMSQSNLVSFQSHTVTHPELANCDLIRIEEECRDSKSFIESITERPVSVLAYPRGSYNQNVIEICKKYYSQCYSINEGFFKNYRLDNDYQYQIDRVYVSRFDSINEFIDKLTYKINTIKSGNFDGDTSKKADIGIIYDHEIYDYSHGKIGIDIGISDSTKFTHLDNGSWWRNDGYNANLTTKKSVTGDFNGDGKDDIAAFYYYDYNTTLHVFLSNGKSFDYQGPEGWWRLNQYDANKIVGRVISGDFNGDGKDDIAALNYSGNFNTSIEVWISNGNGFDYQSVDGWWKSNGYDGSKTTDRVVAGDFNGDGKDDIAAFYDYGSFNSTMHTWLSDGKQFVYQSSDGWWKSNGYNLNKVTGRVIAGDFNGDSKDDIATFYDYGNFETRAHMFVSIGSSFEYQGSNGWWQSKEYDANKITGRVAAGDFNGDGVDDIAANYDYRNENIVVHIFSSDKSKFMYQGSDGWW